MITEKIFSINLLILAFKTKEDGLMGADMNFFITPFFLYLPKIPITENIPPDRIDIDKIPVSKYSI
jgi:hypothetical protein